MKWKTKNGEEIEISEMEDSHLINTVRMLRRKGFITKEELLSALIPCPFNGEMAQDAFYSAQFEALMSPVSLELPELEKELERRHLHA